MTEREYRALKRDSYSSIKDFAKDRKFYYRRHILGEDFTDEEDEDRATMMGSLVDCLLLCPDEFDNKFYISSCTEIPSGMMLKFVEALYRQTLQCINSEGELTVEFATIAQQAYVDVKYDKEGNVVAFKRDKFENVIEKFVGPAKDYYDEIVRVRPNKLMVITMKDLEHANNIIISLKNSAFVSEIINRETNQRYEVRNQVMLQFHFMGMDMKCMIDKVIIDHEEKTVTPYDLKITWNVETFYYTYYLKRFTYIQAIIYQLALQDAYPGYSVKNLSFITADTTNYLHPLIYELNGKDIDNALMGFEENGRYYKGLLTLIEELKWHKETGIWNISKENYERQGVCSLKNP